MSNTNADLGGEGVSAAPYPPSTAIVSLDWAPASTIRRAAQGSDNFPLTWADDDLLYTSFGDGRGFAQAASQKLSLGYARVAGSPGDFVGTNITSPDQKIGDGRTGEKASGMLMVDSVLYMWVRNADNNGNECRLARSTDYAQNWIWSDWTFGEFGYCTFINYGQNYAGARDSYVYMVTHDLPNAYQGTRDFVLTRVPTTAIMQRDQYEFFVGLGTNNQPTWASDISQRGAVFSYPDDRARRSGISYNAALGRYLWWQGFPHSGDERLEGGFGVYDAPEPWGPWTTVYYTENWDVGPGETASFPPKWMSADGTEIHLAFSGNDAFSVRQATLTLAGTPTPTPRVGEPGTPTATPSPAGDSCLDGYYVESGGSVVVEAEQFSDILSGSGSAASISWQPVSTFGDAVAVTMQALPNNDVNTDLGTNGPSLLYDVEFQTPGTYYVYLRGLAPEPDASRSDSLHIGVGNTSVTTDGGTGFTGFTDSDGFNWQNSANDQRTFVEIPAPGRYMINVWMREDGIAVDRLWLSTNASAIAPGDTSAGPQASTCVGVEEADPGTPQSTQSTPSTPSTSNPTGTLMPTGTPMPTNTSAPTDTVTATPVASSTNMPGETPGETPATPVGGPVEETATPIQTDSPITPSTPTPTADAMVSPVPTSIFCPPGADGHLSLSSEAHLRVLNW